jgi:hypothetical protein
VNISYVALPNDSVKAVGVYRNRGAVAFKVAIELGSNSLIGKKDNSGPVRRSVQYE